MTYLFSYLNPYQYKFNISTIILHYGKGAAKSRRGMKKWKWGKGWELPCHSPQSLSIFPCFLYFAPPPIIFWMPGRGYNNLHLSPLADIDKKKRAKHTSPSYGVNWEFSLFEDDVHNHVKKCELKEKNSVRKKPISSCVKITCYLHTWKDCYC